MQRSQVESIASEVDDDSISESSTGQQDIWNWHEHFGRRVCKDDPIWSAYVKVATAHDNDVIEALSRGMDILLVFSGLFSAVVTTFIVQVEPDLKAWDIPSHALKILIELYISSRDPGAINNNLLKYVEENIRYPRLSVGLWYISLYCALLVAGGAVCVKQWLLEYRRSNTLERVPYHRAIRHQENLTSLRRWLIPEFGDFLGCIVLLDLIPFFSGCLFHLSRWRIGDYSMYNLAACLLGVYSTFLAFTIIVGIWIPSSPYNTPISNLVKRVPRVVFQHLISNFGYTAMLLIVLVCSMVAVFVVWIKTSVYDHWLIFLWIVPMVLTIGFGLRNGLKMGRISHFVPIMGTTLGILAAVSWVCSFRRIYFAYEVADVIFPFAIVLAFALVIAVLSCRFSNVRSRGRFPVVSLLFSVTGLAVGLMVSYIFAYTGAEVPKPDFAGWEPWFYVSLVVPPLSAAMIWVSMLLLSTSTLLDEAAIEEDTRAAEALGWLISQAPSTQILHRALVCIPDIANTPLRREKVFGHTRHILAALINSSIDRLEQRNLLQRERGERVMGCGHGGTASYLTLYVTCVAELSQVIAAPEESYPEKWWNTFVLALRQSWLYNNWHRLIVRPSRSNFLREMRFDHHWYPCFRQSPIDMLRADLEFLEGHPSSYLRNMAQAALSQLHFSPPCSHQFSSWPAIWGPTGTESDWQSNSEKVAELRMVTMRVVNMYHRAIKAEASIRRYLYHYCSAVLQIWTSDSNNQDERVLGTAMVLGYLIMENRSDVHRVTSSGDATPMKVARCMMALKRWLDKNQTREGKRDMDTQFRNSLALSMVTATAKYLVLAAQEIDSNDQRMRFIEGPEVDEDSVLTGIKCLEHTLLCLIPQNWPSTSMQSQLILSLEALHSITNHANIELLPLDAESDSITLVMLLLARAVSPSTTLADIMGAIRSVSKILSRMSDLSRIRQLTIDHALSLPKIIGSIARGQSAEHRLIALSAILNIDALRPITGMNLTKNPSHAGQSNLPPSSEAHIDLISQYDADLMELYNLILEDPSSLDLLIEKGSSLTKELVEKNISFIQLLINTLPRACLPSALLQNAQYLDVLASIASHEDKGLVSLPTREMTMTLLVYLMDLSPILPGRLSGYRNMFITRTYVDKIKKAIDLMSECHSSINLKCISMWAEQLDIISKDSLGAQALRQSGLVVAFANAVTWADFGKPREEDRQRLFDVLVDLNDKLMTHR
ncbi:hypothetical protein FRC02_008450 [Tulasnella sp. 418]|nr:hypothetical protein FRC02_008450 [Tulasnella sp. 418]